jgi:hypothetical protein
MPIGFSGFFHGIRTPPGFRSAAMKLVMVLVVMAVFAARVLMLGKRVPNVTIVMKEVLPDLVAHEERAEADARPDEPVLVDHLHVQLLLGL